MLFFYFFFFFCFFSFFSFFFFFWIFQTVTIFKTAIIIEKEKEREQDWMKEKIVDYWREEMKKKKKQMIFVKMYVTDIVSKKRMWVW